MHKTAIKHAVIMFLLGGARLVLQSVGLVWFVFALSEHNF